MSWTRWLGGTPRIASARRAARSCGSSRSAFCGGGRRKLAKSVIVAALGTGTMGAPMARNLVEAGFEVRVWNRTIEKARAVERARVCETAAEAADGADFLLTMLSDGDAVVETVSGGVLDGDA